jgi:hypothetical protein
MREDDTMSEVTVQLELPAELGADVLSGEDVQGLLSQTPDVTLRSVAPTGGSAAHHDFGATLLVIAGTAAAGSAVKGIFDVVITVIREAHENRRQKRQHEHEGRMLALNVGETRHPIDLDRSLAELEQQIDKLRTKAEA